MRVRCLQSELSRAVSAVARATSPRALMPILNSVLLEATPDGLRVAATDLEMAVRVRIPAQVEHPGHVALPARLLAEVTSHLPPTTAELHADGGTARITCENASFELATLPAEDLPSPPDPATRERICSMLAPLFRSMIRRTAFAASKADTSPILTGVHLAADGHTLELAATDGSRLAICRRTGPLDRPVKVTIPARAMNELARLLGGLDRGEVEIALAGSQAVFSAENIELFSQLLQGQFPDYHRVIPAGCLQRVHVNPGHLRSALQRVSATARDEATTVRLVAREDTLRLSSSTPEVGRASDEIPASTDGEPVEVAFNARLLLEALEVVDAEKATLELTGPGSPAALRPVGRDDWIYLIAPVRIASAEQA